MAWTVEALEFAYPQIRWRAPKRVTVSAALPEKLVVVSDEPIVDGRSGLVCQVCIANEGFKGRDIADWPDDEEAFARHTRLAHGFEADLERTAA